MTPTEAAEFLAQYGNVHPDPQRLLSETPNETQLKAADDYCRDHNADPQKTTDAIATMRAHHKL